MKDWWNNLALREKQMLSLGMIAITLFLAYEIIWSPFADKVNLLRNQITQDRALLNWMQKTDTQLKKLVKSSQAKSDSSQGSTLGIVQQRLHESPLAQHVLQLRQGENDSVQFTLQKVSFDKMISLLTELWQKDGLSVLQITVTKNDAPGAVTAEIILQ